MKMRTIYFAFLSVLGVAFLALNGCEKSDEHADCTALSSKIDGHKADYNASPTKANCDLVVGDYNEYINVGCDPDSSYYNLREAFKTAHNNCQ